MLLITSKWDNIHRRNNWKLQRNSYSSCFIGIQSIFLKILSYITQLGILHILHITSWSGIFKLLYCFCYYLLYNLYTSQYQSRSKETTTCTYHHKKKTNQHFFFAPRKILYIESRDQMIVYESLVLYTSTKHVRERHSSIDTNGGHWLKTIDQYWIHFQIM